MLTTVRLSLAATALVCTAILLSGCPRPQEPTGRPPSASPATSPAAPASEPAAPAAKPQAGAAQALPWSRFRGPQGTGIAAFSGIPTAWDGPSGKGIAWKSPVPLPGKSSPVLWGDKVFLTGADGNKREVYCYSASDGKLLWTGEATGIEGSPAEVPEVGEDTGYAAPTPACDAQRVYAIFANGDVACFDHSGKRLWARALGLPDNIYGHAASLLVWQDLLIVPMDQGAGDDGKSKLRALRCSTGETAWEVTRPVPNSWTTPIVMQAAGRQQLITCASPWVIAYDPDRGKELWRTSALGGDVAPSPTFISDRVIVANVNARAAAIPATGSGELPPEALVWTFEESLPDTCSPLATERFVFLLTSEGILTCLSADDGAKLWDHDFATAFRSSPSLVAGKVYLLAENGDTHIIAEKESFEELGVAHLGEPSVCSPAFAEGRVYIRGASSLCSIGG